MNREQLLEDALEHIVTIARRSRTRTNRLAWIEQRADGALRGIPYDPDSFIEPNSEQKTPAEYEFEIRNLRRQVKKYQEILDENGIWAV